jgi:hypothetical protein
LATRVWLRKPVGLLTPLPETKAAPSCSAKTVSTSPAIQLSRSTAASSMRVWVAAGMA